MDKEKEMEELAEKLDQMGYQAWTPMEVADEIIKWGYSRQEKALVPLNENKLLEFFRTLYFCDWEMGYEYNFVDADLNDLLSTKGPEYKEKYGGKELAKAICEKFGTPDVPSVDTISDWLHEISCNEYGDAQSRYDLRLLKDKETLAQYLHTRLTRKN